MGFIMKVESFDDSVVGITSTIPVEIVFAGGLRPLDLNNIFITSPEREALLKDAESMGFSHSICAWIKGIFSVVMNYGIKRVIAVTGGDCSNTLALSELLSRNGVEVIDFNYPYNRDRKALRKEMDRMIRRFSTSWDDVLIWKSRLDKIRKKLKKIDELTYKEEKISGFENHIFLVSSSDFESDPDGFENKIDSFLHEIEMRKPNKDYIRIGYLGVPTVLDNFYEYIEELNGKVVFNEVQRQFSMPFLKDDILETYLSYTYPYDIDGRISDIKEQIRERDLDGLIHYTQAFCYRQIHDIILRRALNIPILSIEGDRPGPLDGRTALRIEAFIDMITNK